MPNESFLKRSGKKYDDIAVERIDDLPERRYFETLTAKVRLTRMTDDTWVGRRGVEHLLQHLPKAREPHILAIDPATVGGKPIGHLGFFRSEFRDTLWRDARTWLDA